MYELMRPLPVDKGTVTQGFGCDLRLGTGAIDYSCIVVNGQPLAGHNGIDYAAETGVWVLAAHNGTVVKGRDPQGYGNFVKLYHPAGYHTTYGHLSEILVADNTPVKIGTVLGRVGSTGMSTGPHLHFQLKIDGVVNPAYGDAIDPFLGRKAFDAR